jgi:hypothetical protein
MTNIYIDFEFTGLHKKTTPISLGMVSEDGQEFYAEFTDYDTGQIDEWLQTNVLDNLILKNSADPYFAKAGVTFVKGNKDFVKKHVEQWFRQWGYIEIWSDCHHYDIVLLHDLFGGAFGMPANVYYIPFDISTVFKTLGIDPDINREVFINRPIEGKHNALHDCRVIEACYDKLMKYRKTYIKKSL